ncbi:unnamed protein product [Protopolystoma xenopodis]|uniref:Uncharacterized protein n=1 Tax=Protopolystoma xenopodis TaxID=117903 RepID=A0A3S5B1E2_9PLAT|nr:unnamed protein product [Protopolystoma xenopodis]
MFSWLRQATRDTPSCVFWCLCLRAHIKCVQSEKQASVELTRRPSGGVNLIRRKHLPRNSLFLAPLSALVGSQQSHSVGQPRRTGGLPPFS